MSAGLAMPAGWCLRPPPAPQASSAKSCARQLPERLEKWLCSSTLDFTAKICDRHLPYLVQCAAALHIAACLRRRQRHLEGHWRSELRSLFRHLSARRRSRPAGRTAAGTGALLYGTRYCMTKHVCMVVCVASAWHTTAAHEHDAKQHEDASKIEQHTGSMVKQIN